MNQILVTKKLYVTPELKRKKKIYKFDFILSVFLVVILASVYIYAEYDRSKSEEFSQEILASEEIAQEDDTVIPEDALVIVLNKDSTVVGGDTPSETEQESQVVSESSPKEGYVKGVKYTNVATVNIPKLDKSFPVLQCDLDKIEVVLKVSPCKFWGGEPNEVGNFCIVGHNYRNDKFFSNVPSLVVGDTITLTDLSKRTITYEIYDKYTVDPEDVACTSQLTNGRKEVTLITCTDDSKHRVVVKTREVK